MAQRKYVALLLISLACPVFSTDSLPSEESIRQLLAVTQAHKRIDIFISQTEGMIKNSTQQALQGQSVTPEQQRVLDRMQAKLAVLLEDELKWDSLEPVFIRIYRESFTPEEIDGMIAIFKTPSGRAIINKMPVVTQKSMEELQKRLGPLTQEIQKIQQETFVEMKRQSSKQ